MAKNDTQLTDSQIGAILFLYTAIGHIHSAEHIGRIVGRQESDRASAWAVERCDPLVRAGFMRPTRAGRYQLTKQGMDMARKIRGAARYG